MDIVIFLLFGLSIYVIGLLLPFLTPLARPVQLFTRHTYLFPYKFYVFTIRLTFFHCYWTVTVSRMRGGLRVPRYARL